MSTPLAVVEVVHRGDVAVISIAGEVDLSNAETVGGKIELDSFGTEAAVLDLTAVDYIDSSGFRLVNALATRFHRLVVVAPEGCVARSTIELAGFDQSLQLSSTVEAAIVRLEIDP